MSTLGHFIFVALGIELMRMGGKRHWAKWPILGAHVGLPAKWPMKPLRKNGISRQDALENKMLFLPHRILNTDRYCGEAFNVFSAN